MNDSTPIILPWKASLMTVILCVLALTAPAPAQPVLPAESLARTIDKIIGAQWGKQHVVPATLADDATFLRRVTLDLAGRIPTETEIRSFVQDAARDKRQRATDRLMASPDFAYHWSNVLDELLQEEKAGDPAFVRYLRHSIEAKAGWDTVFRQVLLGPWDAEPAKGAQRFLRQRIQSVDELAADTTRVFFGVDITCAKCHDHPLVEDWKQDHYYGMASFFNRTFDAKTSIGEKSDGDVSFVTTAGERRTARLMFLDGRVVAEPKTAAPKPVKGKPSSGPPSFSRRAQLVTTALQERRFFSRALVNRVWAYLLGQGVVHPVDQMHSENSPSVPGLLEVLADDFATHGYPLHRLIAGIVASETYQRASVVPTASTPPDAGLFAVAALRPLTPRQFALSLVLATGAANPLTATEPKERARQYERLEGQTRGLTASLDARTDAFQSSATEALFLSNNASVQALFQPAGANLVARMIQTKDDRAAIELACWTILSRPPQPEELREFAALLGARAGAARASVCSQIVWALATSAEFRFNH